MSNLPNDSFTERIVVVDDDDAVLESLGILLDAHKFEPLLYRTGEEIIGAPCPRDVGCFLLDLNLPGMSGLEVMAFVRDKMPGVPVVLMTALRTGRLKKAAMSAGAAALLDKPVEEGTLIEAIKTAIGAAPKTKPSRP